MTRFLLFDRNENLLGPLKDVVSARHPEEINGENVLELITLDFVEKGQRIAYKDNQGYWHEFIIKGVEESHGDVGIERTVFAESSFYETIGDYVEDKRPYNAPANIALESALLTTRWEVGIVDDLGLNSTNFYHISAKEAVQKVAEIWKGELRTRIEVSGTKIIGRYVDLLERRGADRGKRFTYTKDLDLITKIVHRDDVITALYGYGKGELLETVGYGRRITFADLNDGKAYVENLEAKQIWGRLNPDGTKAHVFGKVEFDDCEDPEELLQLTIAKLEELSQPLISYQVTVVDLKALGFEHEGVELGDTVAVIDKEFQPELRLKARVVKITRDLLEPENTVIVLGNFIPSIVDQWTKQERYINNFRVKQGVWDRARIIESDGTINAQYLNNLVAELNAKMNALGGYVYLSEDGKGLITYDKPIDQNPTMAIQLLGGAFRIANSKDPNGEWQWRTFGDGNGFVADAFIGGLLKGGKVHFDLTNGTLLIGNSVEDYQLFWDGSTLKIKGQVHIGSNSIFDSGYDPSEKETPEGAQSKANTALSDAKNYTNALANSLGDMAFRDKVALAQLDNTIISGGFIRTSLLSVDDLYTISAKIGGWSLSDSLIQYRPSSSNNNSRFYLNSAPTGTYRIASYNSSGTRQFSVTSDGALYARNADIAGTITATSGTIGGWNIARGYIDTRDGSARMYLASHADSASYYIYASDSSGNRMFSVSKTGVLYATGADITGKITATSGSFPASLITGALTANQINVSTLSSISSNLGAITGGSLNINNRFRVASNGAMTSTSGTIGGYTISSTSLTGNNVTLGAGSITINGVTLQPYTTANVLYVGGQTRFIGSMSASTIIPLSNTAYDLGMTGVRWKKLYIATGGIDEGSDLRQKQNVRDIPDDLVLQLAEIKPKMYDANGKIHFGYIAQDVERALYKYALNKVGYKKARQYVDDFNLLGRGESYLSLVYSQIAVLKEVEMQKRIDELEKKLKALEEQISN